ncbi:MAG: patatin-like phospholipase family protein [Deltaproteobacteria bacterium]|nr:patatin-like phospholipase family protein [Deltaproteobacteria bacterium]
MNLNRLVCILTIFIAITSCTLKETQPPPIIPEAPVQPPPKPAKIALVLGAGASKGFAHIGALKILETNKIPVHMIVGTSVGSVVGSLYAYGLNAFELQRLSFSIEQKDIVDITIPDNGFIKGEKLEEFVNKTLKNTPMEKLKIPFYAVATEIQNGQETVFNRGNTGQAVRASSAIPGVFRPVKIGDKIYVDGGVVSPVAVDAAKRLGADLVIAVDISASSERTPPGNTIETLLQSINIMYSKLAAIQLSQADVVIRPKVGHIGSADFSKRHEAVLEGEKATIEVMPRIIEMITHLRLEGRLE